MRSRLSLGFAMCVGLVMSAPTAIASSLHVRGCHSNEGGAVEPADVSGRLYCYPSPDGLKLAMVRRGRVLVRLGGRTFPVGRMDFGQIAWNPASTGFAIADNAGSGQTSYFSYVDLGARPPRRHVALREAAVRRFLKMSNCKGLGAYAYGWFDGWADARRVRLVVQQGVHSEGCRPADDEVEIGVLGDPVTGRIDRILRQPEVLREWCTPAQRREYGYCYDERAAAPHSKPPG